MNRYGKHFLEFSDGCDSDAMIAVDSFSIESPTTSELFSNQTLVEDIEPPIPEEYQSEYREKKKHFSEYLDYRGSEPMKIIIGASIESFSTSVWFSIETLMEAIKTVVFENFVFEYRDKSKVCTFLNFRTIRIVMQGTKLRIRQCSFLRR